MWKVFILIVCFAALIFFLVYFFSKNYIKNYNKEINFLPIKPKTKNISNSEKLHKRKELVLAICTENVQWILDVINDYDLVTVYNKCGKSFPFLENIEKVKLINLPNIGSCDYAFLTFIIDRYDSLPDYVHFGKGDKPIQKEEFQRCSACFFSNSKEFQDTLNFKLNDWKFTNNSLKTIECKWVDSGYTNFGEWIKDQPFLNLLMYEQNFCNSQHGGKFGTTKKQIKKTQRNVYKNLKNQQKHQCEEIDHYIERTWRILLCRPIYFLVIVAIFKNEAVAMREWLNHHVNQGVDHFYLINNGSTDNWQPQIEGFPVTVVNDDTKHKQVELYNKYFLDKVKRKSYYVMVIDLDEFVYSHDERKNLAKVIRDDPETDIFSVKWKIFGSNGHITQPESIISEFTKRNKHQNLKINFDKEKEICKTNCLKSFEVHIHNYTKNIKKKYFPEKDTEESLKVSKIHLNHYAIQSKNWFDKVKTKRGDVAMSALDLVRDNGYFKLYDQNEVEDNNLKNISKNYTNNLQKEEVLDNSRLGNFLIGFFAIMHNHFYEGNTTFINNNDYNNLLISKFPKVIKKPFFYDSSFKVSAIMPDNLISIWESPKEMSKNFFINCAPMMKELIGNALEKTAQKNNIVLHFRCSDSPFNRHRSYELPFYRFFKKYIKEFLMKNDPPSKLILINNKNHGIISENANIILRYRDHLVNFIEKNFPGLKVKLRQDFGIEEDFQKMRNCRFLIGASSSFLLSAALSGNQEFSVLMRPRHLIEKNVTPILPENMLFAEVDSLDHSLVKDYRDFETVASQLMLPINAV